jgi:hypothetical protein
VEGRGRPEVVYVTPCWKELDKLTQVYRHLKEAKSFLTVDMFCFDVDVEVGVEFVAQHHLEKAKTVCWKPIEIFSYFVLTWSSFSYLFFPSVILSNQRCGYRRFIRSTL